MLLQPGLGRSVEHDLGRTGNKTETWDTIRRCRTVILERAILLLANTVREFNDYPPALAGCCAGQNTTYVLKLSWHGVDLG